MGCREETQPGQGPLVGEAKTEFQVERLMGD